MWMVLGCFLQDDLAPWLKDLDSDAPERRAAAHQVLLERWEEALPRVEELFKTTRDENLKVECETLLRAIRFEEFCHGVARRSGIPLAPVQRLLLAEIRGDSPAAATSALETFYFTCRRPSQSCALCIQAQAPGFKPRDGDWKKFHEQVEEILNNHGPLDRPPETETIESIETSANVSWRPGALEFLIGHEDKVRATVQRARLGDPRVRATLDQWLESNDRQREAIRGLAFLDARDAAPRVARFLDSPDLRCAALECLARFRDKAHMKRFEALLGDPDLSVRAAAVKALARSGSREPYPGIPELLKVRSVLADEELLKAVVVMNDPKCAAALTESLADRELNEMVRDQVISALRQMRYRPAAGPILQIPGILGQRDPQFRSPAGEFVAELQMKEYEPELLEAVRNARLPGTQESLFRALDRLGTSGKKLQEFVGPLVDQIEWGGAVGRARWACVRILSRDDMDVSAFEARLKEMARMGNEDAVEILEAHGLSVPPDARVPRMPDVEPLLRDPHPKMRGVAIELASQFGREELLPALAEIEKNPVETPVNRKAAAQAREIITHPYWGIESGNLSALDQVARRGEPRFTELLRQLSLCPRNSYDWGGELLAACTLVALGDRSRLEDVLDGLAEEYWNGHSLGFWTRCEEEQQRIKARGYLMLNGLAQPEQLRALLAVEGIEWPGKRGTLDEIFAAVPGRKFQVAIERGGLRDRRYWIGKRSGSLVDLLYHIDRQSLGRLAYLLQADGSIHVITREAALSRFRQGIGKK
jgi:HEAT repeat protein